MKPNRWRIVMEWHTAERLRYYVEARFAFFWIRFPSWFNSTEEATQRIEDEKARYRKPIIIIIGEVR